jgi:hypothetical protein
MCSYKYAINHRHVSIGKKCPYTEIYSKLKCNKVSDFNNIDSDIVLPLDKSGVCIFHSNELEWKRKNNFKAKFLELLDLLNISDINNTTFYDFAEFIFVGEATKSNHHVLNLTDIIFSKEAIFKGAVFADPVEFYNIKFRIGANFTEARFKDKLNMKNIYLWGTDFSKANFNNTTIFDNVEFLNSYSLFSDSQFNNSVFFEDSIFDGIVDFSNTIFDQGKDEQASVSFKNIRFKDFVDFKHSIFNSSVHFRDVTFDSTVEFIDTLFNATKSTIRYVSFAVVFNDIVLNEESTLIFESSNSQNKMFNQDVYFSFKIEPKGRMRFENVNFSRIEDESRKDIIRLSKLGKIEIGSGCIKYRYQTSVKTISIDNDKQSLILEFTQTFTNYFIVSNGFNLGFEVVERDGKKLRFFYFTDENITEVEFLERLEKTEQEFWSLLSPKTNNYLLTDEKHTNNHQDDLKENVIINAVDGLSSLMSIFFRVAIRISFGKWKKKDTKALTDALNIDNQKSIVNPYVLHQTIINHYSQNILFGIKNRQYQYLKK